MITKQSLGQFILKFIFAVIAFIATFFIIYPYSSDIKIFFYRINPINISKNTISYIFTELSEEELSKELLKQNSDEQSLEHLTQDQIDNFIDKHGDLYTVEDKNTILIIDSVNIRGKVVDGTDAQSLDRGFWFYPLSHPFGEKGKSIIIAHRFQYIPPRTDTFYNLDKVQIGDKIKIQQNDIQYIYRVTNIQVIEKDNLEILKQNKARNTLLLITCTPLWTADQRLVITARFEHKTNKI